MKYLDEFRDSAKAGFLSEGDRGPDRVALDIPTTGRCNSWRFAAATPTRSSATASRACCRAQIELVHGPGCPVCVLPMGRVDDCVAIAEEPGVIFATFGDAMRVPGSRKSLLQAKADGADVRMVYSPMDALELARANPDREVVFFGLGFETTMPSTALTILAGRSRGGREFLRLLQPHHHRADDQGDSRQPGSEARRLPRPRPCLDGDRNRALRVHRPLLSQADGHRRVRALGHSAIDLDAAEADQGGAGRDRKPVCAGRSGGGQRARAERRLAGLRTARILRMARPGLDRSFGRQASRRLRPLRRRAQIRHSRTSRSPIPRPASAAKC